MQTPRALALASRPAQLATASVLALLVGCSASADGGTLGAEPAGTPPPSKTPTTSQPDAGSTTPPPASQDAAPPAAPYPAFTPAVPKLLNGGGAILKSPVFVTITWPGDPNADAFEKLGDAIGATSYWSTTVSEYGVGPASSGAANHVRMTSALPTALKGTDVETLVTTNATNGTWPAQTPDTLYVMYLPSTTSIDLGDGSGDACASGTGGYHDNIKSAGRDIPYAVVLQCPSTGLDDATVTASHEMAEASTDTLPSTTQAYAGVDDAHYAWDLMQAFQDEDGDMCEMYEDYLVHVPEMPYAVQRLWSDKSAAAGHAPCVPAPTGAYFNATPLGAMSDLVLDMSSQQGSATQKAGGYQIAVGASRAIEVGFYSDAPSEAWTLSAIEVDPFATSGSGDPFAAAATSLLDLSLDKTSGKNGDKATLTVKVKTAAAPTKGRLVLLVSKLGAQTHYMPMLVGTY
jgi:hypothetical protein